MLSLIRFLRFFSKSKKSWLFTFFAVFHTFSRTMVTMTLKLLSSQGRTWLINLSNQHLCATGADFYRWPWPWGWDSPPFPFPYFPFSPPSLSLILPFSTRSFLFLPLLSWLSSAPVFLSPHSLVSTCSGDFGHVVQSFAFLQHHTTDHTSIARIESLSSALRIGHDVTLDNSQESRQGCSMDNERW